MLARMTMMLGIAAGAAHGGSVLYVDADAPSGGDGLSWNTAYQHVEDALDDAAGGGVSEIRVAEATYTPTAGSDCCAAHATPGCDDPACEATVCAIDSFCCDAEWDASCAALAVDQCTVTCGASRETSFHLVDGVALRGGYAGLGALDPDERNITLFETILSGDLLGDDDTGGSNAENCYSVVDASGNAASAIIDGFTITAGNADGLDTDALPWHSGGGLLAGPGSSATVSTCRFIENFAARGGGIRAYQASPTIIDCDFVNNLAAHAGGGVAMGLDSDVLVTRCTFDNNQGNPQGLKVGGGGGGISVGNANATITECEFTGNTGRNGGGIAVFNTATIIDCQFIDNMASFGGGVCSLGESVVLIRGSLFDGNTASVGLDDVGARGGGLFVEFSEVTVIGCTFDGNQALGDGTTVGRGGGMISRTESTSTVIGCVFTENFAGAHGGGMTNTDSTVSVTNCLFADNMAGLRGGGMFNRISASPTIVNCTFSGNTSVNGGGAINSTDAESGHSEPTVHNCIAWGNSAPQIDDVVGAVTTVTYSNVQNGFAGTGNINVDPMFFNAAAGDYRLSPGSPCIDAGLTWALPADSTDLDVDSDTSELTPHDLDSDPRVADDPATADTGCGPVVVDMGAYEFQGVPGPNPLKLGDIDGSGAVGITDLLAVLAAWGPCSPGCCIADLDLDGTVGITDLLILLSQWG